MEILNHQLFLLINASMPPSPTLSVVSHFIATWLIDLILFALGLALFLGSPNSRKAIITAFGCGLLGYLLCSIIGHTFPHPRPFMLPIGNTFLYHAANASFPSGHATLVFSLGCSLYMSRYRTAGLLILLCGTGIGWARVFLGVHFPFDILGAFPVSLLAAWITHTLGRVFKSK
ncbi:MAG: undecaprenyl-diphosphatase [Plesiomonas sp.]|uniref:undecaprenyl-diphosphatase n=1 Tax=Plesiomonas sp. TaxID=2486279 RepID=UPI003F4172F3